MPRFFSISWLMSPRFPRSKERSGIYLWSGYRGHKFVRQEIVEDIEGKEEDQKGCEQNGRRNDRVSYRYSVGVSGYATENHQGRTTLSTTSFLDSCPLFPRSFSVSFLCHLSSLYSFSPFPPLPL